MCGIAGIIEAEKPVSLQLLQRMCDALAHRGPDDAGTWLSPEARPKERSGTDPELGDRRSFRLIDDSALGRAVCPKICRNSEGTELHVSPPVGLVPMSMQFLVGACGKEAP